MKFEGIVKTCFHEKLKPVGFLKKGNNFYRDLGEIGHIVNIQKSMYGSRDRLSFTANIGIFTPAYWKAQFDFTHSGEPPKYPIEPVSTLRRRIGEFMEGNDKWYDLSQETDDRPIQEELSQTMDVKVLPFLNQMNSVSRLIDYLEGDSSRWDLAYARFVLYGELGMQDKLLALYPLLIHKCPKLQRAFVHEKALKYGIA